MNILTGVYLAAINLTAFFAMGADKFFAIKKHRRIRERTLFALAIVGGSIGSVCGMFFFRHKTKKATFLFGLPLILTSQLIVLYFVIK
ncbi:MAG: DUF1294 domain-containing protein [Oscillospiraceae bacterium]